MKQTLQINPMISHNAGTDFAGSFINCAEASHASFQFKWEGLTGTLDGEVSLEVTNDNGNTWTPKSGANYVIDSASGNESFSLPGNITEEGIRVVYNKNGCTGGTINCFATLKG